MKIIDLGQHVHELRAAKTGRPIGAGMSLTEVWSAATDCEKNGISDIRIHLTTMPRPFDGMFFRLRKADVSSEKVAIYINKNLPAHLREFVAIKEIMHCWSPGKTYVGTPIDAKHLVSAMSATKGPYTPNVVSDWIAIYAACEVILPHYTVEWHIKQEHEIAQIAVSHSIHPEIAELICSYDNIAHRKNATL